MESASPPHVPFQYLGRVALLSRFGIKAVQQHSPTKKGGMVTKGAQ